MPIPVAVAPAILTPGLYISVNLLSGAASPGQGVLKILLLCPKATSGDLTANAEIRAGAGPDSAGVAWGSGTPGHLAAKQIYTKYPAAQVFFGAPTAGATASTLNVTASGSPSVNTSVHFDVMGREFDVAWNALETADTFKTRAILEINSRGSDLAVTASSGGVGIVTFTGKVLGRISLDILIKATLNFAVSATEAIAGAATHTPLAGGTTDDGLVVFGEGHDQRPFFAVRARVRAPLRAEKAKRRWTAPARADHVSSVAIPRLTSPREGGAAPRLRARSGSARATRTARRRPVRATWRRSSRTSTT